MYVLHMSCGVAIVPGFYYAERHEWVELNSRIIQDQCKTTIFLRTTLNCYCHEKVSIDSQIKGKYIKKYFLKLKE